jgi:hypothetical protein
LSHHRDAWLNQRRERDVVEAQVRDPALQPEFV